VKSGISAAMNFFTRSYSARESMISFSTSGVNMSRTVRSNRSRSL
jgi:hypothetical protein